MIGDILGRQKRSRLFAFCLPGLSSLNPYIWSSFIIKSSNNLASTGWSRPFFEQSIFIDNKFYIFTFWFILFTIFFDQKNQIKSAFHFSFNSCAAFLYTCANGLKIIYRGHVVVKLIIYIYRQGRKMIVGVSKYSLPVYFRKIFDLKNRANWVEQKVFT